MIVEIGRLSERQNAIMQNVESVSNYMVMYSNEL